MTPDSEPAETVVVDPVDPDAEANDTISSAIDADERTSPASPKTKSFPMQ